jgi:nickel-dependent lactate racemase
LVKSPHPIDEIAARISRANGGGVRLMHESAGQNGSQLDHVSSPSDATLAALSQPIDFPPLAAGIVPGDRVAIAIDESIPCVGEIARGAIRAFENAGVKHECISVVSCDASTNKICREACTAEEASGVKFIVHDPDDAENLCMVGVSRRRKEPLLVNRTIFDADVVLPIGCARVNGRGAYESLFPRFSSADAIRRYRTPTNLESAAEQEARTRETDEAGWLIGVQMIVEVVPGSGESVANVLAGEPTAVAAKSAELSRERWLLESPQQVNLVIATVTGGPESQTWANVGRALANAEPLTTESGAVAICSNLSEPPGHSLGRLIGNLDLEAAERKISHDHDADSFAAWQLAKALQRGPVYFLSQLDAETVEDLGLAPIENIDELVRLAARQENFVLVEDSQNAVVRLAGNGDER